MFFRVDDPMQLDGPTFFARVWRLPHYRGVMRDVVMAEAQRDQPASSPQGSSSQAQPRKVVSEAQLASELGGAPGWLDRT